jgi:osmotically-inducible protein OsmY
VRAANIALAGASYIDASQDDDSKREDLMNVKYGFLSAIAVAMVVGHAPASAADVDRPHLFKTKPANERLLVPTDAIHSGGMSASDEALAGAVAQALASDPGLYGATATVVANNGQIMLSGSAKNVQQAARAEQLAKRVAGVTAVSGTLDAQEG